MSSSRSSVLCSFPRRAIPALLFTLLALPASIAQQRSPAMSPVAEPLPIDRGAAGLWQDIQKLRTRASLIMIVAHPDDEDGPMLTYESRDQGADVSLLTLNRGEGGQNLMSSELWDPLGLIRTQELLAADQYYGVHQYFTRVIDFGFSKTLEESMQQWGHDRVLYDVVRVIRITRPLIVTASFIGGVSDGHGQHQVSGVMAQEVFNAAADPNVFPDQIAAGLRPWAPLKVYARVPSARVTKEGLFDYATGRYGAVQFRDYVHNTTFQGMPSTTVTVPEGNANSLLADTPFAIARSGLGQQKSQNGGVAVPLPRPASSAYHLYASRLAPALPQHEDSFFDGIDTSLAAIASYAPADKQPELRQRLNSIAESVQHAADNFDATNPAKSAPALADGLRQTDSLLLYATSSGLPADAVYNIQHELETKRDQFNQALTGALGLRLVATADNLPAPRPAGTAQAVAGGEGEGPTRDNGFQSVVAGQSFRVTLHLANQGPEPIAVDNLRILTHSGLGWGIEPKAPGPATIKPNDAADQAFAVTVPPNAEPTRPYFARKSLEQSYYDILDPKSLNLPTSPDPLSAEASFSYHGARILLDADVQTTHRYIGPGPVLEPLLVAPAISVTVSPTAGVVPLDSASLRVQVTIRSSLQRPSDGTVHLELPPGWTSQPASEPFHIDGYNEERIVGFTIAPHGVKPQPYTIAAVADSDGHTFRQGFQMAGYAPLRPYPFYRDATYQTTGVDLKIAPSLRVAYIMGTGDEVPQSLENVGVHVTVLSPQDIATADLSGYDVVLLGVRTYSARPELVRANQRLLNYVSNGGVVVVQYQSAEFNGSFAPYPISLTGNGERVIEEENKVNILLPNDPVLNFPNHITSADFDNWIEERGHGFPPTFAPQYTALTETHDNEQDPQRGGLLYTRYGKGVWVYTAYAFFRQMPEGVPGSFRIMANLLSISKNPAFIPATPTSAPSQPRRR